MLRCLGQSSQDRWAQRRAVTASLKLSQTQLNTPGSGCLTTLASFPESAGPPGQLECWPPAGCLGLSQSRLSVQAPLPTSCPQHAGTKPGWMETTPPLAGGLCCGTEGVGAGRGLSVHLLRRAGVHPGPLRPQGQRTLCRPAKSTGELWGLYGSKVWDGFPSLACWLL